MAEEIKQNEFKPIPTGSDTPAPRGFGQGQGQRQGQRGGFGNAQAGGRRLGFGRAGFGKDRPKDEFETKLLDLARVTRVTGGGKRMSFRAVVVAGDKKGKIGIGIDKGKDVSQAIDKATRRAKKDLLNVVIIDGTIPHEVEAKYGPAVILLKPHYTNR